MMLAENDFGPGHAFESMPCPNQDMANFNFIALDVSNTETYASLFTAEWDLFSAWAGAAPRKVFVSEGKRVAPVQNDNLNSAWVRGFPNEERVEWEAERQ